MRRITIIGIVGLPAKYGGFETLANFLTKELARKFQITVYCSQKAYPKKLEAFNGANLKYTNLSANGAQSVIYDILSMLKAYRQTDIFLILGVSGAILIPFIKIFSKKKIIVNIDGLEWRRNKFNKLTKFFLKTFEKIAVKYADNIISDNKVIQNYVKKEYGKESKFIPYGADHVEKISIKSYMYKAYPFLEKKYAFLVCRIEPENNIHVILDAMHNYKNLNLVVVGNWHASKYGSALKAKFNNFEGIYLYDPIYDQEKLDILRSNCYLYIHGHSAGGTNPSLVEAMYLGLPVIAYDINFNKETTENKALYFKNSKDLHYHLRDNNEEDLCLLGKNMKALAEKKYEWKYITKSYEELFNKD